MAPATISVSVILTVKNDPVGTAEILDSLVVQSRPPEEIIVVDGGSTDETVAVVRRFIAEFSRIQLIECPGANIARGRNVGTSAARGEVIAVTDAGCRAVPNWVEELIQPFAADPSVEFVAGFYHIAPKTLLENVIGLATMRGQLDPVDPISFNPSARSMAYTKRLWSRVGGWPEWLRFSEDTFFNHRIRACGAVRRFAGDAVVHWRPRGSFRTLAKQFYRYGTGRGHTRIDARSFHYNLRNLTLLAIGFGACRLTWWALAPAVTMFLYFFIWTFHGKALRIARSTHRVVTYPLCVLVMWVVMTSNLVGYLVGAWQRLRDRERFKPVIAAAALSASGLEAGT